MKADMAALFQQVPISPGVESLGDIKVWKRRQNA
jgi:hypothetical protein